MTLYSVFPGSFVLSFAYAEAAFIVLAALCLLFLVEERWLLAGSQQRSELAPGQTAAH